MGTTELRLDLSDLLKTTSGTPNVYYQPPENFKMKYPAIVYKRARNTVRHANNHSYHLSRHFYFTYITQDPDTEIPDQLNSLPRCQMVRDPYIADNLYHYPFKIYY